jgi:hypothetical protein
MTTGDRLLLGQGAVDQVQLEYGVARPNAEARTTKQSSAGIIEAALLSE